MNENFEMVTSRALPNLICATTRGSGEIHGEQTAPHKSYRSAGEHIEREGHSRMIADSDQNSSRNVEDESGKVNLCSSEIRGQKQLRALVVSAFLYSDMNANRPYSVACALSQLAQVDVLTSDFNHSTKTRNIVEEAAPIRTITYIKTPRYATNISFMRIYSHLMFSIRAARYLRSRLDAFDIVYTTLPFNILSWWILSRSRVRLKIVDVMDRWPDSLPFPRSFKKLFAPALAVWRNFLKGSIRQSDLVMAVSDECLDATKKYARMGACLKRFYIGHELLESQVSKQPILTIAYVGNIGSLYDFETLLDVLGEHHWSNKMQLFVIGQGDRRDWLLEQLTKRGIKHRYFGPIFDSSRLAEILCGCHIGFNGYRNTTAAFSYKANTYFAAGLPILNSMDGDLKKLVKERGLGLNYRGGDRASLRSRFVEIEEGALNVMSQNCTQFFAAEIERRKIRVDMLNFIKQAFNDKNQKQLADPNGEIHQNG